MLPGEFAINSPNFFFLFPHLNSVLCIAVLEGVSLQIRCSGHQATPSLQVHACNYLTHSNCWSLALHNTAVHQSVHRCDVQASFLLSLYWNVWGRTTDVPTLHHQCIENQIRPSVSGLINSKLKLFPNIGSVLQPWLLKNLWNQKWGHG